MAVSVKDVAAAAGVSVGTVSNVLNRPDRVSPSVAARVQRAIADLGFVRNDAARQLRAGRSRALGLVVLDTGNPFFAEVARGAQERAAEDGMSVLLGSSGEDPDREAGYLDLFHEQRVNGILVTPAGADLARLERIRAAGTPVVLVDRLAPGSPFGSVSVDDRAGGELAVRHLVERGRRRILFLAGPLHVPQVADRLAGARQAIADAPEVQLEVLPMPALTVLHGREAGTRLLSRSPEDRPDAVFAANDLLAVGVLQALALVEHVRVPEEIALIGYDDIDFAASTVVPLSSVRQPAAAIGRAAVDLLLRTQEDPDGDHPRTIRFQPELVVRASTGG